MSDPDDLSNVPAMFRDEPEPARQQPPQRKQELAPAAPITPREEPRGIGPAPSYNKEPVGCVVEILKRGYEQSMNNGKGGWLLYPPFDRATPKDAKWAFAVLTPTTVTTRTIGTRDSPSRAPHPDFLAFNTCDPEKAQSLGMKIVHFTPEQAWNFHLGAYKAPPGRTGPQSGWWCKGDGKTALRKENGKEFSIVCPNRMCEFQQEGSGPRGQGTHCKIHTRLIGQFNWAAGSPLPRIMFEWSSQSYHAYQNIEAVFKQVRDTAAGFKMPDLPIIGLPIRLSVKQTIKQGKRYPEVHASFDGDVMDYIGKIRGAMIDGQIAGPQLSAPVALRELPPPGLSQDDIDKANQSRLNPNYRPSNERP